MTAAGPEDGILPANEKTNNNRVADLVKVTHQSVDSDHEYVPPDEKEWKRLRWKLDRRIVPYIGILYLCSFLDRVNVGNCLLYFSRAETVHD